MGTPGLGTSASHSSSEPLDSVKRRENGVWWGHGQVLHPTASMCRGGLRGPAAVVASLTPGLVEIRAVALRNVAIKGVQSLRYLCMGEDGRMLGLVGGTMGWEALWRGCGGGGRGGPSPDFPGFLPLAPLEFRGEDCQGRIKLKSDFFYRSLGSRAEGRVKAAFEFSVGPKGGPVRPRKPTAGPSLVPNRKTHAGLFSLGLAVGGPRSVPLPVVF